MNEKTKFPPIPTIPTFAEVVAKKARCEPLTALDGFVRRFDQGGEQSIELAVALQGLLVEACADTAADRAQRQAGHDRLTDEHRLRGVAIAQCWAALKTLGIEPDSKTGLAGAVQRLAAAGQAAPAPLAPEQIDATIRNWFADEWACEKARGLLGDLGIGPR